MDREYEVELGSTNTYTFGYAYTGNLANCGRWIYTDHTHNQSHQEGAIVGMLVDLDRQCKRSCDDLTIVKLSITGAMENCKKANQLFL